MPNNSRSIFPQHDLGFKPSDDPLDGVDKVAEYGTTARNNGNRKKKGRSKDRDVLQNADETPAEEIVLRQSPPTRASSIAGPIPYSYPRPARRPASPVLDAIGDTEKVSDPHLTDRTDAWAQAVPCGRSPPAALSKDANHNASFTNSQQIRGGFSNKSPPISPPQRKARPVSYGSGLRPAPPRQGSLDNGYPYAASAYGSSPPLPHLPQPHFYGAPDIDLGFGNRRRAPSSDHATSFIGFSEIPSTNIDGRRALLVGSEGRLDILVLDKKESRPIGALEGLGGTVLAAAFLTWEEGDDPFCDQRPLVALSIYGPKVGDKLINDHDGENGGLEHSDVLPSVAAHPSSNINGFNEEYETRVEVYSLITRTRIATLFKTPPVALQPGLRGFPPSPPPPVGDLRLDAQSNFITVSSGTSGEVFAFGIKDSIFQCLAKLWTTVQPKESRRSSSASGYADRDVSPAELRATHKPSELPILALGGRWLAICPPGPVSRPALGAMVPSTLVTSKVPGFDSYNPPPRPSETCTIDSPDAPSFLNRVARGVAQEVVKGARWLGDQGLQSWNNYWKRDQHSQSAQTSPYNQPTYSPEQLPGVFPPTHGQETQTPNEPELVSIVDLRKLQHGQGTKTVEALTAIATFQPPGGCSFLSFNPSGLSLFTASRKGDVQYVWDLMQVKYCRAAAFIAAQSDATQTNTATVSPCVRQIAKFSRLTTSSLIDVVWSSPVGDRLAVATRNGTVHVFDLPLSAFQWPPLRHPTWNGPVSAPSTPAVNPQRDEPEFTGYLSAAMKYASKTQPILANLRGRAPSVGSGGVSAIGTNSIGFASATGVRSGKAVAAGLSQSLGVAAGTVNTFRHAGDSRVHLHYMAKDPARSRVIWDAQSGHSGMLIVDGNSVRLYRVRRTFVKGQRQNQSVVDSKDIGNIKIPGVGQLTSIGSTKQTGETDDGSLQGYWKLRPAISSKARLEDSHPLSHAEIETNAPYQPFHSDRRVSLSIFSTEKSLSESEMPTASAIFGTPSTTAHFITSPSTSEQWVFGNDIPTTRLNVRSSSSYDDNEEGDDDTIVSSVYRRTTMEGEGAGEQIVSTTKTKKNRKGATSASLVAGGRGNLGEDEDDEFFEDDMEVLDYAGDRV